MLSLLMICFPRKHTHLLRKTPSLLQFLLLVVLCRFSVSPWEGINQFSHQIQSKLNLWKVQCYCSGLILIKYSVNKFFIRSWQDILWSTQSILEWSFNVSSKVYDDFAMNISTCLRFQLSIKWKSMRLSCRWKRSMLSTHDGSTVSHSLGEGPVTAAPFSILMNLSQKIIRLFYLTQTPLSWLREPRVCRSLLNGNWKK